MLAISFNSVLIIAGIAVLVPVVLGLVPRLPVPGAVLEVIAGGDEEDRDEDPLANRVELVLESDRVHVEAAGPGA